MVQSNEEMEGFRHENKFVITGMDYPEVIHLVKMIPFAFREIFYERSVNNIYLDTIGLDNYENNLAGNAERIKVRIRWYGKLFGQIDKPVLELKIKKNQLGKKRSFSLKSFRLDENFDSDYLQKEVFAKSNLPEELKERLKLYKVSLLNRYRRRYFQSADGKYRITLDKDLEFVEIGKKDNSFKNRVSQTGIIVLEAKYDHKDFEGISDILQYLPFRLVANSKYVTGLNMLRF